MNNGQSSAHQEVGKHYWLTQLPEEIFIRGKIDYHFPIRKDNKSSIIVVEQQHRLKNLSNTSDLYYQQRFNSYDSEQTITVQQELLEHFAEEDFIHNEWIDKLDVRKLLNEPLIQLSNGENKRVQLIIALTWKILSY